jgi:small subunit ribosomal protein S11
MGSSKTASNSRSKKRNKRNIVNGIAHISASFNNTIVTITDCSGNVLVSKSGGSTKLKLKGTRKKTPFAARVAAEEAISIAREEFGLKTLIIYTKGPGSGREAALQELLRGEGVQHLFIKDTTGIPHNGPRRPKPRRV